MLLISKQVRFLFGVVAPAALVACGSSDHCAAGNECGASAVDDAYGTDASPSPTASTPIFIAPRLTDEPAVPLGPPPPEATLTTETFTVPPGGERFICQNFDNPFLGNTVDIVESEHTMTPGSHHMFAFQKEGLTNGPLEECAGLEYDRFIHSSQLPHLVRTYPPGLGRRLPGNHGIRIQAHYLNTTEDPLEAQVTLILRMAEVGTVQQYVGQLFMNNMDIDIAPLSPGSASKTCSVPANIQLLSASGHMHETGVYLRAETSDGRLIYETSDWSEPAVPSFDPPFAVAPATEITYRCDYQNFKDIELTFGGSAATNEMCIFGADYFPAPNGQNIDCLF